MKCLIIASLLLAGCASTPCPAPPKPAPGAHLMINRWTCMEAPDNLQPESPDVVVIGCKINGSSGVLVMMSQEDWDKAKKAQ